MSHAIAFGTGVLVALALLIIESPPADGDKQAKAAMAMVFMGLAAVLWSLR